MAEPQRKPIDWKALPARVAHFAARVGADLGRRGYALALMAIILWTSWQAISYLLVSLFWPADSPAQVRDVPRRLDESLLHGRRPDWLGLEAVENPRSPIGHYHRIDTWLPEDRFNDCTRSGCHSPLPHSERKEVRAFLNMHTAALHCGACHMESDATPLSLTWYSLEDGRPTPAPILLAAYRRLMELDRHPPVTAAAVRTTAGELRAAAAAGDGDPGLRQAAAHLESVHPDSVRFPAALAAARDLTARSFRGAYGAKLAQRTSEGQPRLSHPDPEATQDLLKLLADGDAGEAQRASAVKAAHLLKRAAPLNCADCHAAEGGRIDWATLGYPPERIEALRDPIVIRMIENISAGQPFQMP